MSWVYYADRKPTQADANKHGKVIVWFSDESQGFYPWDYQFSTPEYRAWLDPKLLPPLPPRKIWRTPTQADLDKATEPILCRYKNYPEEKYKWSIGWLYGLSKFPCRERFLVDGVPYRFCEIEVDS